MQRRQLIGALIAAVGAGGTGIALAQPQRPDFDRDRGHGRGPRDRDDRHDHRDHRDRHDEWRHDRRRDHRHHAWRRGTRLPYEYRSRTYVVDDWRARRLAPPPRGHRWVSVDADYLLVAIATGLIVQVIAGR
jgi:Ni/Co efflux regulator RcnB